MSELGLLMGLSEILAFYVPYNVLTEKQKKYVDELEDRIEKLIKEM